MSPTQTLTSDDVLMQIQSGMTVYDLNRRELGVVASIYLKGVLAGEMDEETHPTPVISTISGTFVEDRRLPELLYVRLSRTGFAKVNPRREAELRGIYYITPQQILRVEPTWIGLNVPSEGVLRY